MWRRPKPLEDPRDQDWEELRNTLPDEAHKLAVLRARWKHGLPQRRPERPTVAFLVQQAREILRELGIEA